MIIGIGGSSRSGKSSLASSLAAALTESKVLSLDNYAFSEIHLPRIRDRFNWEIPEAYDFDELIADVEKSRQSYANVIVEGILIFCESKLTDLLDKRIFLNISKSTFASRRADEERWGAEPDWFIDYVWSSYLKHGQMESPQNYIVLDGEKPINMSDLIAALNL
ncbi:MAG: hypothetical protein AAF843_16680 [Bacteroidota bacterium]